MSPCFLVLSYLFPLIHIITPRSVKFVLILSSKLSLGLSSGVFSLGFPIIPYSARLRNESQQLRVRDLMTSWKKAIHTTTCPWISVVELYSIIKELYNNNNTKKKNLINKQHCLVFGTVRAESCTAPANTLAMTTVEGRRCSYRLKPHTTRN